MKSGYYAQGREFWTWWRLGFIKYDEKLKPFLRLKYSDWLYPAWYLRIGRYEFALYLY